MVEFDNQLVNEQELRKILREMRIHNVYYLGKGDLSRVIEMIKRRYRNQKKKKLNKFVKSFRSRGIREYYY